jgi:hypothetical protein
LITEKGDVKMSESNTRNTGNDVDFKQMIKDLRIAVEESIETLKKLEVNGTEQDANSALWSVTAIWNGKEYSTIEAALRAKGHKSGLGKSLEK